MTDRYWNKTGDNSNGLTEATAYNNFTSVNADMVDGDTVLVGDGTYTDTEVETSGGLGYALPSAGVTIQAQNTGGVTITAAVATAIFRWSTDLTGNTINFIGINFADGAASPNYHIWINNTGTLGTITVTDCNFANSVFYDINMDSSPAMNVTVTNCHATSAASRALLFAPDMSDGDVIVSGGSATYTAKANSTSALQIGASVAGVTARVSGFTLNMTIASGAPVQEFGGVEILNIDDGIIENCSLTAVSAGTTASSALAIIDCDSGTLTANRGIIRNNTGMSDTIGGFLSRYGHDNSNAGDDRCNDGIIFNNSFTGSDRFREAIGHGLFFGFCTNGNSSFNKVDQVGLGLLCKAATGGGHFANKVTRFGKASNDTGSGMQSKGCTNTKYYGNTIELGSDSYGAGFAANDNGGINNSGIEVESNTMLVTEATPAGTFVMSAAASQVVVFKKNNYLNTDLVTLAAPMNDLGTTRTVAAWVTNVEDDANVDDDTSSLVIFPSASAGPALTRPLTTDLTG